MVEVSHVDVFEGGDRSLVQPTYNSLLPNNAVVTAIDPGFNRLMNAWDYGGQSLLYGWAYPTGLAWQRCADPTSRRRHGHPAGSAPVELAGEQLRDRGAGDQCADSR